jgi:hypothetical protein
MLLVGNRNGNGYGNGSGSAFGYAVTRAGGGHP